MNSHGKAHFYHLDAGVKRLSVIHTLYVFANTLGSRVYAWVVVV